MYNIFIVYIISLLYTFQTVDLKGCRNIYYYGTFNSLHGGYIKCCYEISLDRIKKLMILIRKCNFHHKKIISPLRCGRNDNVMEICIAFKGNGIILKCFMAY